jgi:hypothetical protein
VPLVALEYDFILCEYAERLLGLLSISGAVISVVLEQAPMFVRIRIHGCALHRWVAHGLVAFRAIFVGAVVLRIVVFSITSSPAFSVEPI